MPEKPIHIVAYRRQLFWSLLLVGLLPLAIIAGLSLFRGDGFTAGIVFGLIALTTLAAWVAASRLTAPVKVAGRRVAELTALQEISTRLGSAREPQDVVAIVAEGVKTLIGADDVRIFSYDRAADSLTPITIQSVNHYKQNFDVAPRRDGLTAIVARTGRAMIVNDPSTHPLYQSYVANWPLSAIAGIPFVWNGRTLAVMNIAFVDCSHEFTESEIGTLNILAEQAALALENARLYQELEQNVEARTSELAQRVDQLDLINHVGQYITFLREQQTLLPTIADLIRGAFDFYAVIIMMVDPASGKLRLAGLSSVEPDVSLDPDQLWSLDLGIVGLAATTSKPVVVNDIRKEARYYHYEGLPRVCSEMALPLIVGDQFLGVLDLESERYDAFLPGDENVFLTLADQIAVAIHNADLFRAEADARRIADRLREVGQIVNSTLDLQEVLDRILQSLQAVLAYDSASVLLLRDDVLQVEAVRGFEQPEEIIGFRLPLADYPLDREIIETGIPKILFNVHEDPLWLGDKAPGTAHIRGWMGIPLVASGAAIGLLAIDSRKAGEYNATHLPVATAFASQVSIAVQNARLFEEIRQRAHQLATINELGRIVFGELDKGEILRTLGEQLWTVMPVNSFYASIYHADSGTLDFPVRCDDGIYQPPDKGPLEDYPWNAHIIRSKEPLRVLRSEAELAAEVERRSQLGDTNPVSASMLFAPLMMGVDILGVISVQSNALNAYTQADLDLLVGTARQTAIALRNAELYGQAQAARAEAEEANRLKSQFLANMSHELRTPLNSIINFAYLLTMGTEGQLGAGQEDLINRIGDAGRHLLGLINDFLDLAKIEAGRMELYIEEVHLPELINGVMSTAAGLLHDKPIELHREAPSDLPPVRADHTRVRQVLLNLLSNAAKFTEHGKITLKAWSDERWVTVSVTDTGIGMNPDDIPKAFADFVQLDGSLARTTGGTGLGLPISKRFIEMHGGRIWAESQPGVGSTFYFTLPRFQTSAPIEPPRKLEDARVLVIDDDPASCEMVALQLTQGYNVLALSDSRQAVEKVRESRPDVVVLDVMMPHQDGWEVLKALKSDPVTQSIPVVICSILREQKLALSLGASDYLVKPVSPQDVQRVVEQFVAPGGRILAVDDDADALEIFQRLLGSAACEVITAQNGRAGLEAIREQQPSVVILDLMMPGLTGFDVLAALRSDEQTASLPVIVVTAKDLTPQERQALQTGAAALLQKGQFSADEINQAVRRALARRPRRGAND